MTLQVETAPVPVLGRYDLMLFERRLQQALSLIFPCEGHSMLFPRTATGEEAVLREEEKKLLLPLVDEDGALLGVFMARGVDPDQVRPLLPSWPALRPLVLDNLRLYKQTLCDPVTGLYSKNYLHRCLERGLELLREAAGPAGGAARERTPGQTTASSFAETGFPVMFPEHPGHAGVPLRGSLGLVVVRIPGMRAIVRRFGYQFADALIKSLADAFCQAAGAGCLACRTGDYEFSAYVPSATPSSCRKLACDIAEALSRVRGEHALRQEQVGVTPLTGYIVYPQDMDGNVFMRPAPEQARLILRKGRLAAALAEENRQPGQAPVLAFSHILARGGRVLEVLPFSRAVVSLGSAMHAREGLYFSVWDSGSRGEKDGCKGEIVLVAVKEHTSQAEVVRQTDPGRPLEPGDSLVLQPERGISAVREASGRQDPATGLMAHSDFCARWAEERDACASFALVLVRLSLPEPSDSTGLGDSEDDSAAGLFAHQHDAGEAERETLLARAVRICREELGHDVLGGRYGTDSLMFFHPDADQAALLAAYQGLEQRLASALELRMSAGVALHPFLDFRKSDALDNCRKALEYAMLLPAPQVGLLDTLALNIHADKLFSQGDIFGAVQEYQRALLADEKNGMAWNSLGICLASLDRHGEAERHFTRALECDPADVMALYNLGCVHQSRHKPDVARIYFHKCLEQDPDHLFALLRLGQIQENKGDRQGAREFYRRAAGLPGGHNLTCRHFARLSIAEGDLETGRELLHEALVHDPQDAVALQLLAGLYLDGGEDPAMAASLARHSVCLRPELKTGWLELARALEALGHPEQAKEARLRAAAL